MKENRKRQKCQIKSGKLRKTKKKPLSFTYAETRFKFVCAIST